MAASEKAWEPGAGGRMRAKVATDDASTTLPTLSPKPRSSKYRGHAIHQGTPLVSLARAIVTVWSSTNGTFPLQLDLVRAGDAEALQAALASLAPRATKDFFGEAARSPNPRFLRTDETSRGTGERIVNGGTAGHASSRYDWPGRPREDDLSRPSRLSCSLGDEGGEGAWPEDLRGGGGSFRQDREAAARRCRRRPRRVAKTLILEEDVNGKKENGWTPLHEAAYSGHTSVVTALVTRGATVNGKTNLGSTPLHFAAQEGHEAAAEELIVKGADVNAKDKNGYTPLHLAAFNGHTAMVEMLIGKGAEPNAKEMEAIESESVARSTPLHFAAQEGHEAAAEELIVKGADVNAKDEDGDTALHIAASQGHLHVLFMLVKLGAATNVENRQGMTPKELLEGTSTPANYDMEIFKGISLIEIMEKYLAAEKGKASLRRENMSLQNKHKKELKSIKEDQRKRDADSQNLKKEISALKDKIKAIEEEHKAELRNVAENQQEKEAEILRMQNEIVGLKETVASRDEKIKSLEEEHKAELRNVADNQHEKETEILKMQNKIVGLEETIASRDEKIKSLEGLRGQRQRLRDGAALETPRQRPLRLRLLRSVLRAFLKVPAQDTDRGPFQERRQEERRGRETQAAGENKEQVVSASVLHDTIKLLQEQSTKELLSIRNAQHLKEAEAASQLREAQEALKSRDKRVKTLKEILLILHPVSGKEEVATQPWP
ncbi:putative serine/threonine-protein phosphatase 6 regulatory ankyrin repeat subunit A-like [Penaeus vannamei]|uniref:Putative serine/threonine-protein phosphatase 6 regulatory ankyrin repeat subunit A-like n=1 Tax=Penaeus vannamei TaxID=6689 RepID=A0A3R7MG98_PENVA|nr:putative serine/threonine-protein phosphatase 6 regulatory ankyrin repeat subunit A-like [Penaeus vannamei]